MAEETTYLVLLLNDNPSSAPGLWCTKSGDLGSLIRKCGLRFTTCHIYELAEQPSYLPPEYVQWGGMKLHHVAEVSPTHDWARAMNLLTDALMETSKEQIQQLTQQTVSRVVETCQRRLVMRDEEEPDPEVETIFLGEETNQL